VGLLPIIIYTLYVQNHRLQQFKNEAAILSKKIRRKREQEHTDIKPAEAASGEAITFENENQTEKKNG
jgi:hypothetical protein